MKRAVRILLKTLKWLIITILAILLLLVIVVKVPAVHDFILQRATTYFNEKTGGDLNIRAIDLRLPTYVQLEGISLQSPDSKRVAYVGDIEVSLGWRYLLDQTIRVDKLTLKDVEGRVFQKNESGWNYDFIVEGFSDSTATPPDTTSGSNWDFSIGYVELSNIDLAYYDYITNDSIHAIIGDFSVAMDDFSVNENTYLADRIALENSAAYVRIGERNEAGTEVEDSTEENINEKTTPLNLGLNSLLLSQNTILYAMGAAPDKYLFAIGTLEASLDELDIDKQKYRADRLALSNTNIHMKLAPAPPDTTSEALSIFAPIDAKLGQLAIDSVNFKMETYGEPGSTITMNNIGVDLHDALIDSTRYAGKIEKIAGTYNQFTELKNFSTGFEISAKESALSNLNLKYGQSTLDANVSVQYDALDSLVSSGSFQTASLEIARLRVTPGDLRKIGRKLDIPDSVLVLPSSPITLKVKAMGDRQVLKVPNIELTTGQTRLALKAEARGNSWTTKNYHIDSLNIALNRNDILPYITAYELDTNYIPPQSRLYLRGDFATDSTDLFATMASTYGGFTLTGNGGGYASDQLPIKAKLESENLNYAGFLGMPEPFNSDILLTASMQNALDTNNLQVNADLKIDTLNYQAYRLHHLGLNAELDSNLYAAKFLIDDTFAVANLGVTGNIEPYLSAKLDGEIKGIDLQGLRFSDDDLRGKFNIKAQFSQIDSTQKGSLLINEILFVRDEQRYAFDPVTASVFLSPDSSGADIKSPFLDLKSESNRSLGNLGKEMANTFGRIQRVDADTSAYWRLDFETKNNADLRRLFIPQLTEFAAASGTIDYSAAKNKIDADIDIPKIRYDSFVIDSLQINSVGNKERIEANLYLKKAAMDTLAVQNLKLSTRTTDQGAHAELRIGGDSVETDYFIGVNLIADSVKLANGFNINITDSLVLNNELWKVDPQNDFHYSPEGMALKQLRIFKGESELAFTKVKDESATSISASSFDLKTLAGLVNTKNPIISGRLFGDFKLIASGAFNGEGHIEDFHVSKANLGKLGWQAEKAESGFDVAINSKGGSVDFDLQGDIIPRDSVESKLDLKLDLNKLDMAALPKLVPSQFYKGKGKMTGKIAITGASSAPQLEGSFDIADATIGLTANGATYTIKNQSIKIRPKEFDFNNFALQDSSGNTLNIAGKITHENFDHIKSDLHIETSDFVIANLKPGRNADMYGKLIADADIDITGRLDAPKIDAKIGISKNTDFTYMVPESNYEDPFDEDLIKWTRFDSTKTESILTREKEKKTAKVDIYANTIDLNGEINIDDKATFRVVIDSAAGDYLKIQGGGNLGITYDRTGNLKLNGTYEVRDGFYQMTFYNIVKKKFDFQQGSQLVWNGDPMAATLDITALYKTKASVAGLMMTDPGNQSAQTFNERLPFEVVMNLKGSLLKPEITFDIRVAEESRGAFGGSVEARLAEMRDNQNELNKQVFALLVLNTFLSSGGSNQNLVANQARNSASQILSQQLNALSSKVVKGVDLNFNLDSYGGAAGEGNTDLNIDLAKSFANDRVVVRIGSTIALEDNSSANTSQDSKEMMTNIAIEYKITPDGTYRFKAYRKNDYEDIVVGRITRTGVGVLFQHDFSRFRNIFKTQTKEPANDRKDAEEDQENSEEEK